MYSFVGWKQRLTGKQAERRQGSRSKRLQRTQREGGRDDGWAEKKTQPNGFKKKERRRNKNLKTREKVRAVEEENEERRRQRCVAKKRMIKKNNTI